MSSDFLNIIKENKGIIYKIIRIYAKGYDERQDLYQDIVYQLWKSYPKFQGKSKVSTWIYKIALNTSFAHINLKKKQVGKVDIEVVEHQIEDKMDANQEERIEEMYNQIRKLNEIDRAIIFLFLEGKDYEEIANISGFTETNVGTRLNRIKQKLKNEITKN